MKNKFKKELWEKYLCFTDEVLGSNRENIFLNNHYFLSPTKPDGLIIQTLISIHKTNLLYKLKLKAKFSYNLFSYLSKALLSIFLNTTSRQYKYNQESKYDLIVVSHLNNLDQLKISHDQYYGDLIKYLNKRDLKVLLVLIPHCNYNATIIKNLLLNRLNHNIHILDEKIINLKEALNIILSIIKLRLNLIKISTQKTGFLKNLYLFTANSLFSADNQKNLTYSSQIFELVKKTKSKNIITTYEGHSWEKLFFYYSRIANNEIKCFGYQHTLIFKEDFSILRSLNKTFNPEVIFCTGNISKNLLQKSLNNEIKIISVGTPKYFKNSKILENKKNKFLLFLPSGEETESFTMTEFAYKFAKLNPKLNIIIRYHPIIKNKFQKSNKYQLDNFEISSSNIICDSSKSKWAIYNSSTAIFEAIQNGCLPVKIELNELNTINDPLWQIRSPIIKKIKTANDLSILIRKDINSSRSNKKNRQEFEILLKKINLLRSKFDQELIHDELII